MNDERLLTLEQLQDALQDILPLGPDGKARRPSRATLYRWLERKPFPMPCVPRPSGHGRWFRLSAVLEWLEDPAAFWSAHKARVSSWRRKARLVR